MHYLNLVLGGGNLDTADGTEGLLNVTVDGELTGSQSTLAFV